jgi:predicted permease
MFRPKRKTSDFGAEIEAHIELETERLREQGLSHEDARTAARRAFGNVTRAQERFYESGCWLWWDDFWHDLRHALRMLRKQPAFTLVAILTLALGVGANVAIFSIVNAVLLRSLSYRDPGRLVRVSFNEPGLGLRDITFSKPELDDLATRADVFAQMSAIAGGNVAMTGVKQAERLELAVTGFDYFTMLGAVPELGRLYGPQDYDPGFSPYAVISDAFWRREFGGTPDVLGRTITLDGDPSTIVGVLAPGFHHPAVTAGNVDVWCPAGFSADPFPKPIRSNRGLNPGIVARLKPGLTLAQAQARLTSLAAQLRHDFPADYPVQAGWTVEIQPLQEFLVGNVRTMLLVLMAAVMLIVFIVSLNIANLILARASARQQEMAVRLALGASPGRMVRQALTESLLLSFIGGLAGCASAFATLGFILRFVPPSIPRLSEVRIDWVVLLFALLISILTGLVFGFVPALHSTKVALSSAIREGGRGSGYSTRTGRLRDVLIVSELAFAVVLMVGAGLLLRTLRDLLQQNPGFDPTQVVAANVWIPVPDDPKDDLYRSIAPKATFDRELLRRMKAMPGVELAAITSDLPTSNHTVNDPQGNDVLAIEDRALESSKDLRAERIRVSPDYFKVMQSTLVAGRFFSEGDEDGKLPVVIIDETTARKYWPARDPLGRRVRFGQDPTQPWMTVVGIVKDIKSDGLDIDGVPHIYVSVYQNPNRAFSVVLRTSLPAAVLDSQIRHEIQSMDPGLPVFNVSSMNDVLDRSLASRRFSAQLVGGFAGLALLLASLGIYGLLAYMVSQRSREIGVRMALGAQRANILKLILQKGMVLAGVGVIAGVILSASTASMMASLLYGVRPHDPAVFLVVPLLLFAVAVVASYLPARRATKVDPMIALREA